MLAKGSNMDICDTVPMEILEDGIMFLDEF